MAKTTKKDFQNSPDREGEKTYTARLTIGGVRVAGITLRATSDKDAQEQLARAKPSYFEGLGEWTLTKREDVEVK